MKCEFRRHLLAGIVATGLLGTASAEDDPQSRVLVAIEARFIRGRDVLSSPKVTVLAGTSAILRMVEKLYLPNGEKDPSREAGALAMGLDAFDIGSILEVNPSIVDDRIRLEGKATFRSWPTDAAKKQDIEPGASFVTTYEMHESTTPFAITLTRGQDTVLLPGADTGGGPIQVHLTAFVVDAAALAARAPASPASQVYRQIHHGYALAMAFRDEIANGDSLARVRDLLGPGRVLEGNERNRVVAAIAELREISAESHPDATAADDVIVEWDFKGRAGPFTNGGALHLQFRDGKVINHDPKRFRNGPPRTRDIPEP